MSLSQKSKILNVLSSDFSFKMSKDEMKYLSPFFSVALVGSIMGLSNSQTIPYIAFNSIAIGINIAILTSILNINIKKMKKCCDKEINKSMEL